MSELGDLENAIVATVSAIQEGGNDLFATVKGFSGPGGDAIAAAIRAELKPAAYVAFAGRRATRGEAWLVGDPRFSVIVAQEGLRGGSEPRLGSSSVTGGLDLLNKLAIALQNAILLTDRKLLLIDEGVLAADDRTYIARQQYDVLRVSQASQPTFNGQTVCGADSIVHVVIRAARADMTEFAFPGINGVFRHHLGLRGRQITWRGQLRADDDAGLNAIEASLESLAADPAAHSMVDPWGRTHTDCVLDSFERNGARNKDHYTGQATQDFELVFTQLS